MDRDLAVQLRLHLGLDEPGAVDHLDGVHDAGLKVGALVALGEPALAQQAPPAVSAGDGTSLVALLDGRPLAEVGLHGAGGPGAHGHLPHGVGSVKHHGW